MRKRRTSARRLLLESSMQNQPNNSSTDLMNETTGLAPEERKQEERSPKRRSDESKALKNPLVDVKRSKEANKRKRRIERNGNEISINEPPVKKMKKNGNNRNNKKVYSEIRKKSKEQGCGYEIRQSDRADLDTKKARKHKQVSSPTKLNSQTKNIYQSTNTIGHDQDSNYSDENSVEESLYDRLMNRNSWISKSSSLEQPVDTNEATSSPENEETLNSSIYVENGEHRPNQMMKDNGIENFESQEISSGRNSEQNSTTMDAPSNDFKVPMRDDDNTFELDVDAVNEAEEGTSSKWEVSSDFDGEDDALLLAMKAQQKRYIEAAASNGQDSVRGHLLRTDNGMASAWDSPMRGPLNMKEEWYLEYQRKPPQYFKSSEAKMEVDQKVVETSTGQHKATSYSGVKLNEKNNADVAFVFNREFETTNQADRSTWNTYSNFKTCIGQLARVGIALGKLSLEDFWKPGEFFQIASNISFFHYFVRYFTQTSTPATVMNKCGQLVKFVDSALEYWDLNPPHGDDQVQNMKFRAKIKNVSRFLRRDRSMNKAKALKIRQRTKQDWHRCTVGKFVDEDTLDCMRKVCSGDLQGILNTVCSKFNEKGAIDISLKRRVIQDIVLKNPPLLKKWCVNFTAMLLVYGNGQRPQVYSKLKAPSVADMLSFGNGEIEEGAEKPLLIEITDLEKRDRCSKLPFLMLDPAVAKFVDFQVQFVLPFLLDKFNNRLETAESKKLLLDTRNGKPLNVKNVKNTLKVWMKEIDPELNVTPMDLRASYCTIMVRRHVHRRELSGGDKNNFSFQNLSEKEFKEMLSCVMNTSIEQVDSIYASASHSEYSTQVAQIMNICKSGSQVTKNAV